MNAKIFKSGGIHFWNIGRIGGSFYCKRKPCKPIPKLTAAELQNIPYRTPLWEYAMICFVAATVLSGSLAVFALAHYRLPLVVGAPVHYLSAGVIK